MMNLKEISKRKEEGAKILRKALGMGNPELSLNEIDILVKCLEDLQHLNDLVNYVGEKSMQIQDRKRLSQT